MDPYLEDPAFWQDFHRSFVDDIRDEVLRQVPDSYDARIDESLRLVEADEGGSTSRIPDVNITRDPARSPSGGVAVLEDVAIEAVPNRMLHIVEVRDVWIEVRNRDSRELVTVIEVLSPANKCGKGWFDYDNKRRQLVEQNVNLVEIDLLLAGKRIELRDPLPPGDYFAFVTRVGPIEKPVRHPLGVDVYTWSIERRLPPVPIPLRYPDADLSIALDPIFDKTWTRGRYARVLRYDRPHESLPPDRQSWAKFLLDAARASA
jgi:hypothetical protein